MFVEQFVESLAGEAGLLGRPRDIAIQLPQQVFEIPPFGVPQHMQRGGARRSLISRLGGFGGIAAPSGGLKISTTQFGAPGQDKCPFNHVSQFPYVPRPRVFGQEFEGISRESFDWRVGRP